MIAACGSSPPHKTPRKDRGTPVSKVVDLPATRSPAPGTPVPTGAVAGTAHPLIVEAVARDGSWIAICQARVDTDGNGKVELNVGMHGEVWGDQLTPYIVRHDGEGEPIDAVVGFQGDRWLVALRQGKLALFDARSGAWDELARADLRDDGVPLGPHRAASVARDAERMVYFRDDQTMIVRELATGAEKAVTVPGARLWRVEVEPLGHWALVYAIVKDTDGDGKLSWPTVRTSLSGRGCRGPVGSYSTGGWGGDKPEELWLDLAAGTINAKRGVQPIAPPRTTPRPKVDGREVLAVDSDGRQLLAPADAGRDIPNGPLEWVKP